MENEQALKDKILELEKQLEEQKAKEQNKEQFFATTVHELRTPLNAIVGLSTLVLDSDDMPSTLLEYISQIHTSSEFLVSLVNDILDFSKIEAGKIELENIPFSLDDMIENLSNIVGIQAKKKGLELLFDIDKSLPKMIISDPLRLKQVLINLVSNAIKFTHSGSITISARLLENIGKKTYIEFCVSDTGIGMSKEQIAKLFGVFVQADPSISREYGGSGLGLNISKKLIELMGGTIRIESEVNKGSKFIFSIEMKTTASSTSTETNIAKRKVLKMDLEKFKDTHILLADDNVTNQSLILALLKGTGIEMTMANDGQEVLDIMNKNTDIDLILMDINMPRMGGIEATAKLRRQSRYKDIPIIAFSGDSDEGTIAKIKEIGITDILYKPIVVEKLYQILKDNLKIRHTIKERYIKAIKDFELWLENYEYQKIMSLIGSIKKETKTKENKAIQEGALLVETAIEKYKNLFLVLIKNHSKAVQTYVRCINTLEKGTVTDEQNKRLSSIIVNYESKDIQVLLAFAEKIESATEKLIALVEILRFKKATELARELQEEAREYGINSIVKSLAPIVGIEVTQRNKLKILLENFKKEIENMNK